MSTWRTSAAPTSIRSALHPDPGPASLRIAVWRLDAGGRPDPAVLIRGAHLARYAHDFRLVRRLIEAVPGEQLDAVGALLLGEALYELGDFEAAERVLARGQRLVGNEHVALRLAVTRTKNAQWGLCQPEAAIAINVAARSVVTSPPLAEELVADEASILTFGRAGDQRAATATLHRSNRLAQACEGAATPGLIRVVGAAPLSGREREIVMLAAQGMSSKDIADRLYLSVRTVGNHLQHAYAKLGVTSRAELARALGSDS